MDQNIPYITAMNFEAISRGILVKASSQVVNKNDKITFTWSEDQYTSQNYPFHSYDVEFRVYSTPSSCVTELYSNPITPFTWSKPFEFYNSTGQIKVSTSNIVSPFNLYDKNTQQPLKFVAADGSKKDFKFNPYCLYMFKVWPHNNLAPSLSEQYRKEGPYGIVYIIGSKRWGGF